MSPYLQLIRQKKFWVPVLIFLCFDLCLQTGIYRPYLKKGSFAANVVRNTEYILEKKPVFEPTILVLGTSVAYQGLSLETLNKALEPYGEKVQSLAMEGTELVVQDSLIRNLLPKFPKVHTVLHILEISTPWVDQELLQIHTLAMLGELDRRIAFPIIFDFNYKVKYDDIGFLTFKSIAYRRDIRDFLLDPSKRLKDIGRRRKEPRLTPWPHENTNLPSISMYPEVKDIASCIKITNPNNGRPAPEGSDQFHKKAIWDTCDLARTNSKDITRTKRALNYFHRLEILHGDIRRIGKENGHEIKIIGVIAPYSELIKDWRNPERNRIWQEEIQKIHPDTVLLDYQDSLDGANNGDYYYDLIHLNKAGMHKFSDIFAADLPSILGIGQKKAK
ncbi:SGNH/GDSL hydrolase family protein [Leptospira langatensis]|uniref:SGNH/GDSL hydrolase family protein n=1 Tax=Leptospira langatensis TaxID=2484983 RepID=A0A5F1ZQ64_9LEPT|nr:SGNH/GDSL hydrolase family protein [Leptospira langatensis]TGK01868.1 SGNH/GDSL hydrolase family protein [Leptospira langatensis]TGL39473.1 SGNH/GDSL hydrolase family protein [Leptospira langatensis]